MPNHVTNIVNLSGDKEKIAEMLEAIKDEEYGIGTIDFNKITPMPESLKITAGSQTERGLGYYKAFVDVYTLMGTRKGLDLLNIPEESEKVFLRARTDIDEETFISKHGQQRRLPGINNRRCMYLSGSAIVKIRLTLF